MVNLSPEESLKQFIHNAGFVPVKPITMDGEFHHLYKAGTKSVKASYKAFDDKPINGFIKDFVSGQKITWQYEHDQSFHPRLSREEYQEQREQQAIDKANREKQAMLDKERAAKTAFGFYQNSDNATRYDTPYLEHKNINGYGIKTLHGYNKLNGDGERVIPDGTALIPIRNNKTFIVGAQLIKPNGDKSYLYGSDKSGHYHVCGRINKHDDKPIMIAEGYATAATLHQHTRLPVVVSFDAGNLVQVAENIHAKYPKKHKIICADNDYNRINQQTGEYENIGLIKANEASEKINAHIIYPEFNDDERACDYTDYNDLYNARGEQEFKQALRGQYKEFLKQNSKQHEGR